MFLGYRIFDDGKIYSCKRKRFLQHDIVKGGYHQVSLSQNGVARKFKVHRLVAYCFCNPPENYRELTVDHVDGNKDDNAAENLEWCTMYENNKRARENGLNNISLSNSLRWNDEDFRRQTSKKISESRIRSGISAGKNNGMFRYAIKDKNQNEYDISSLANKLGLSYSGTYRLVKNYCSGKNNKYFLQLGISIEDIKSNVNRLSKESQEKIS